MVIPDLVLFVNGIPLVVMEAKSPTLGKEWQTKAVRQLRRYQEAGPEWQGAGAPELFHYNLLCVAHSGVGASYAAMGAPENAYFEWKSMLPYSESDLQRWGFEAHGQAQLIAGLLAPSTLLDILRDYVVYEADRGQLVKKLPRYQQYRAVVKAMERVLAGGKPEERGGVVWHTQGSGKSLTMLWMAVKVRREPKLAGATVLIVTDRTQLDRQISATFEHCGFPAPEQATSTRNLRRLLTTGVGRTIMTTVQKFEGRSFDPAGRAGRAQRGRQRRRHGRRGAPDAVRAAGGADVEGAAQRHAYRFYGYAHRPGLQAEHDAALRYAHRRLHNSAGGGGRRHRAHPLRASAA